MLPEKTTSITIEEVQKSLPSRKGAITQDIVDIFNSSATEAEFQGETLLNSAITYEAVLQRNKASIHEYLRALKFCAYLVSMEDNFTEAYKKTFNDREFVKLRVDATTDSVKYRELTSAASRYRKSKLVVDILTTSQVPLDMMFTGARYKAIGILADVMVTAKYDRDKINAAKELLAATKGSDNMKIELDIGVKESSAVQQLNEQLARLADSSLIHLKHGTTDLSTLGSMKVIKEEDIMDAEIDNG